MKKKYPRFLILIIFLIIIISLIYFTTNSKQIIIKHPSTEEIEELRKENTLLSSRLEEIKKKLLEYEPEKIEGGINLANWKEEEIITAMSKYAPELTTVRFYDYIYNEDGSYYEQFGPIFGVDSFYELVYDYRDQELDVGHLRLFNLGYGDTQLALSKYQSYLNDVLRETQVDPGLKCHTQKECSDIKVTICTKDARVYYSWFEGNYLFIARDDNKLTLNAFTKFYCKEYPITGKTVYSNDNPFLLDKLSFFLHNLLNKINFKIF